MLQLYLTITLSAFLFHSPGLDNARTWEIERRKAEQAAKPALAKLASVASKGEDEVAKLDQTVNVLKTDFDKDLLAGTGALQAAQDQADYDKKFLQRELQERSDRKRKLEELTLRSAAGADGSHSCF